MHIHKTHRQLTQGKKVVETTGASVAECLENLLEIHPGMQAVLFEKNGKLRNLIEVYINHESAYPDELKKAVKDGDEIHLTFMLAGG